MAKNIVFDHGDQLSLPVTAPATPTSGDPVLVGELPGVALTDENTEGNTTVKLNGVANLEVVGTSDDGTTDAAISAGDVVYYDTDDTLNVDSSNGTRFGYALEDVASGATSTIRVKIGY